MSKHNEFLAKLKELMVQYNAEMTAEYNDSGCECCGGWYEFDIATVTDEGSVVTTINTSYLDGYDVGRAIK